MSHDVRASASSNASPLAFAVQNGSAEFLLTAAVRQPVHTTTHVVVLGVQGLLGDAKTFKLEFEKRITAGNDKNATGRDRQIAAAKAAELRARIAPFFLRREKKDVLPSNDRYIQDMSKTSCCMLTGPMPALISPYYLLNDCTLNYCHKVIVPLH